jgi:hypothetical protein
MRIREGGVAVSLETSRLAQAAYEPLIPSRPELQTEVINQELSGASQIAYALYIRTLPGKQARPMETPYARIGTGELP